jgi:predicted nucleic acid-binding protein
MPMVIDTSLTMSWCFEDEATEESDAILDRLVHDEAVVPSLWEFEVTNVLLVAERRARITEAQAARFLDLGDGRHSPPGSWATSRPQRS